MLPEVRYEFEVSGASGAGWRLQRFRLSEGLSKLYEGQIDLVTEGLEADPDAMLGRNAALMIHRGDSTRRVMGVIRRVEHLGRANDDQRLARVVLVPALFKLTQRSDTRIFQDKTVPQIVQAVLRAGGLYAGRVTLQLDGQYRVREYCTQYHESDFAFIERLLAEEGITWHFRHEADGEHFILTDGTTAWGQANHGRPVPIVGAEAATHEVETVRHLHAHEEQRPTSVTVRDYDFTHAEETVQARAGAGEDLRPGYEFAHDLVFAEYSDPTYGAHNAEAQAQRRLDAQRATARAAVGVGNVTGFYPGGTFAPQNHERAEFDRELLLMTVEHFGYVPEATDLETQHAVRGEERYRNEFTCIASNVQYRPQRPTTRPVIAGIQTAVVVGRPGEEIDPDEHGRIKVQFPWDRQGQRNQFSSCWLRVVQGAWAGNGWGMVAIPRVGMEVVVAFLEGNPDRPVVTGSLYNSDNRPPYPLPEGRNKMTLRSNSTPGGGGYNELRFDDSAGTEEIFVHGQYDWNTVIEHDTTQRVGHDETRTVGHDETLTVDHDQRNTIHHDRTETVDHDHRETIGNDRTLHVVANDRQSIDQNQEVTIGVDHASTIGSNHTTHVGGNMVLTVMRNRNETVALLSNEMVGVAKTVEVVGPYEVTVGAHHGVRVVGPITASSAASISAEARRDVSVRSGAKTSVSAGDDISIRGDKKAVISIHDQLTLVCGEASVTLKRNGDVKIKGRKIQVEGSGDVVIRGSKVGVN